MNKVILIGRISNDLKLLTTKTNISYLRFTLAITRKKYKNSQGGDIVDYVPVVAWRNNAIFLEKNADKGVRILVEGLFVSNSFTNSQGQRITTNEVSAENVSILETVKEIENRKKNRHINTEEINIEEYVNDVDKKPSFYTEEVVSDSDQKNSNSNDEWLEDDFSWDEVDNIF
ncbi:single-stranded DNA-binding protein [[Mycoplasma] collis]|uniref:single-stranded DNA-binding protein n=1 Tax=[Mycoplasma] collis TaxID=2127 RepID=UPI0006899023|nr:single-stranded DNA-binding protein [[Mycoplasma] collis]